MCVRYSLPSLPPSPPLSSPRVSYLHIYVCACVVSICVRGILVYVRCVSVYIFVCAMFIYILCVSGYLCVCVCVHACAQCMYACIYILCARCIATYLRVWLLVCVHLPHLTTHISSPPFTLTGVYILCMVYFCVCV